MLAGWRPGAGRERAARSHAPARLRLQPAAGTRAGGCGLCRRASSQEWRRRHFKEGVKGHAKRCSYPEKELVCYWAIQLNAFHTLLLEKMVVDWSYYWKYSFNCRGKWHCHHIIVHIHLFCILSSQISEFVSSLSHPCTPGWVSELQVGIS